MSYELIETSIDLGRPIRLYKFMRGIVTWAYCTADRDVTYQSVMYKSIPGGLRDSGIRQSGEATADAFEITAPSNIDVAQLYRGVGPSDKIELTVYDMHFGETQAIIAYIGSIYTVKFPAQDRCTIVCNTDSVGLNAMGLTLTWARGCPYTLYERGCEVNRDLYKIDATVQSKTGLTISSGTFESYDDAWFAGGYVEWPVGTGLFDRRGIVSHVGSVLELLGGTQGIGLGLTITAYPGCNKTIQQCHDKFENDPNYGGAPHQPGKSPFDGTPVF